MKVKKLIFASVVFILVSPAVFADTTLVQELNSDEDINVWQTINGNEVTGYWDINGNSSAYVNGVNLVWSEHNPNYIAEHEDSWNKDDRGLTATTIDRIVKNIYTPWKLRLKNYRLLQDFIDLIRIVTQPEIDQLKYKQEAQEIMIKELVESDYKLYEEVLDADFEEEHGMTSEDVFEVIYCQAKCEVAENYGLEYIKCDYKGEENELKCSEGPEDVWYCSHKIDEDTEEAPLRYEYKDGEMVFEQPTGIK